MSDWLANGWVRLLIAVIIIYLLYRFFFAGSMMVSSSRPLEAPAVDGDAYVVEDTSQPFKDRPAPFSVGGNMSDSATAQNDIKYNDEVLPYPQISNRYTQQADSMFNSQVLLPKDLLPQEGAFSAWNAASPQPQGALSDQNFLAAGHHYGINTVGQSLKNANYQLRSDPPIPQVSVGPWYQSTIDADTNRRPMEIGGCP